MIIWAFFNSRLGCWIDDLSTRTDIFPKEVSINPCVFHTLGDHAFSHGTFPYLSTLRDTGATKRISGKFLSVLKRQDDGAWKILVDCFNPNGAAE